MYSEIVLSKALILFANL